MLDNQPHQVEVPFSELTLRNGPHDKAPDAVAGGVLLAKGEQRQKEHVLGDVLHAKTLEKRHEVGLVAHLRAGHVGRRTGHRENGGLFEQIIGHRIQAFSQEQLLYTYCTQIKNDSALQKQELYLAWAKSQGTTTSPLYGFLPMINRLVHTTDENCVLVQYNNIDMPFTVKYCELENVIKNNEEFQFLMSAVRKTFHEGPKQQNDQGSRAYHSIHGSTNFKLCGVPVN